MAMDHSLSTLVSTLSSSIESAADALPQDDAITLPKEGISLLDVKNELFLSYLQNLVFLIVLKLQSQRLNEVDPKGDVSSTRDQVIRKLVELRVYLEKGVRPLENRLKYQIDKVIRAADDAARSTAQRSKREGRHSKHTSVGNSDADSASEESGSESQGSASPTQEIDELAYRPNPSAFARPQPASASKASHAQSQDGIYRPPRITPTALPTTQGREEREARKPGKSATVDEFIATELSTAPVAEPSIGSTIAGGGRSMKSRKQREEEAERREYEETNFIRLPKESRKERAKKHNRARDAGWGGEEWRGLGAGLDRIERLTQKKGGSSGSLEKSRKRAIQDGPRGTGAEVGEVFEKRRKFSSRSRK